MIKNKLKILTKFLCLIVYFSLLFQPKISEATHASAAELTYSYVGTTHYILTYTLYSKCGGNNPSNSVSVVSNNDCGFSSYNYTLPLVGNATELSVTCPGDTTRCYGGPYEGFRKFVYSDTLNLYYQCNWKLTVLNTSRPNELTSIVQPGQQEMDVFCMINNTGGLNNNSPKFITDPIFFYCVNQPVQINVAVNDSENDSVSYSLIRPRNGISDTDTVTYLPGYSYTQPLQCNFSMAFDSINGNFIGTPIYSDVSVYAILVSEFRNGILIGQIERDAIIFVNNCTNMNPLLSGFNGSPSKLLNVQANQQNYFQIYSIDGNSVDQTTIEYDSSISGMSFFFSRGQRDTAFFSWMPTIADTAQNSHCFTLKVKDDNCPYPGVRVEQYCLNVSTVVGIENNSKVELLISPNPFNSEINLSSSIAGKVEVKLFDIQGRQVMNSIVTDSNGPVKLDNLEEGIYLISIKSLTSGHTYWKRVIKD